MAQNPSTPLSADRERSSLLLPSSMKRALSSGELSDVQFSVGREFGPAKCFHAHKLVLCLRSSVFYAMFYGGLPERCDQPIDIPDILPDAFGNMLSFLYTDTTENLHLDNLIQTSMCADKYDLPLLVEMCSDFASAGLTVDNCLTILENAICLRADMIVGCCLEFIDGCADDILQSEHFAALEQKTMVMILQRDTLSADEHNVYLAVERWAQEACKAHNMEPTAANRHQVLGEALFLVRFPLLSNTELADGPIQSGLLLQFEVHDLFQYKYATVKPSLPFSGQPRKGSAFRVGKVELRYKELVFVKKITTSSIWKPAEIVGVRQTVFLHQWPLSCGRIFRGTAGSGNIVRASDILQPGLMLFAEINDLLEYVAYIKRDGDRYAVLHNGSTYTVTFDSLVLDDNDVSHDVRLIF
ncbi:BTB/POZ domain-containing protein 6-B-like [Paramacrobiotus metropolitanus]|uniref:BTB/POZ domain-containing protein 6-B-like n=1 Tax=Paramacrobiotus metropolitanus TaxID=2943436 RepID=UPI002445ACCD|nr:BTB/POZ domain-containing protein 6-B-like [Paramacrobiotus metropolitanus]